MSVRKTVEMQRGPLSPEALDEYATTYYLNSDVEDIDIEERAQRHSVPLLLRAIDGCDRVLEMGYGTGLITTELLAHGAPIEVLEGSATLSEHARRRHPGLVVHTGMFEQFDQTGFDAVLALHVLEHVDDPVALLEIIRGWLVDGGTIVAVTPNAQSLHRQLAVRMGLHENLDDLSPRDRLVGHQRVFDLGKLQHTLQQGGFDVVDQFGYFVKPLANAQMLDWSEDLLEGFNALADVVPAWLCANIGVVARCAAH
jgi:2-polyprenyl-3-methyl-5-hydroxy-6-metoxy-1,4-benzoquinol methylase